LNERPRSREDEEAVKVGGMTDGSLRRQVAVIAGVAVALGAGGALYRVTRRTVPEAPLTAAVNPSAQPDDAPGDWCAPGFEPIRGHACFARDRTNSAAPLIVYLHGRYARDAASDEIDRQRRLALRATGLGYAVLALRGRLGTCTSPELASWYCWPSNETNASAGPAFVEGWTTALEAAQERAGSRQRFLLGFSNGGYFADLIASRGLLEVDALVVAHGGPVEPVHALRGTPPLLLLSADDDIAQDEMIRLDEELTREHWAHDSYARAGAHGLTDGDIDNALIFFSRAGETLPLTPPLPLHRAVRHARDAGTETPVSAQEEAGAATPPAGDEDGGAPPRPGTGPGDADEDPPGEP
jgi:predicted esterase